MFSSRLPRELEPNRLTRAVCLARADGRQLIDLTLSNPTRAGLRYPAGILEPLSRPEACTYEPDPRGSLTARAAVVEDYARRGIRVATNRVVLTASTSEAYSMLFKLLCAPGDGVLVPAPSYPLFDHLTRLDAVESIPYRLEYYGRWCVDESSVVSGWTDRVRAVLAVSPNNPTGSALSDAEIASMEARCAQRGAALVVDEVFADYSLSGSGAAASALPSSSESLRRTRGDRGESRKRGESAPLTFRLGGLSKSAGLPQVKLGWIAVEGPDDLVDAALDRLDLICDTYLSVSTPVQVAAPELIERGADVRAQILERVRGNYETLGRLAAADPAIELLNADAGWSAVLRIPSTRPEEDFALDLLETAGVIVYPGFFFDFPHEAFIVVSLLPEPEAFGDGVRRILDRVHG